MNRPNPTQLDAEMQITMYETDMNREYLPNDIFDTLSSEYINPTGEEPGSLPNAIYLKLKANADQASEVQVTMVKDLSGPPTIGANADQRNREETIVTKWFRQQYTDLSHATTNQAYGKYARDRAPYKVFEYRVEGLARYFKQYFGKMRRQTVVEMQSENLEDAPHFLDPQLNHNWFVPRLPNWQQPVWRENQSAWAGAIVNALNTAGTGVGAAVSIYCLQRLEEWARTEAFITPIEFEDGGDGYVLTLPTPQAVLLKNSIQAGQAGQVWRDAQAFSSEIRFMYPGLLGQFGGIRVVEDVRYPTLTIGGSGSSVSGSGSGSGAVTIQYRGMGLADDGSSDPRDRSASARQLGLLLGRAGICEWMPEGFHWEWDYEQYDKYFGSGIFCSVGIKNVVYNKHDHDDSTAQQMGNAVVPFAAPPELWPSAGLMVD